MEKEKIEGIIFDWAGTTVDYGCFAPLNVFLKVFRKEGVDITLEEARKPMGMLKIDHIRTLTQMPRISEEWKKVHGTLPTENDVVQMYSEFEPSIISILKDFSDPIPGVIDTVKTLRDMGLKIGSTTGYTDAMMDVVAKEAAAKGYQPDCYFTPDSVTAGRPAPWMIFRNAMELDIYPMYHLIKVGDTIADVKEGLNAGCFSVGVCLGSNMMGLHEDEAKALPADELEKKIQEVTEKYYAAGAHFVLRSITDLPALVEKINAKLPEVRGTFRLK